LSVVAVVFRPLPGGTAIYIRITAQVEARRAGLSSYHWGCLFCLFCQPCQPMSARGRQG
jgi:hypothetical protein